MASSSQNRPFRDADVRRRFERAADTFDQADFLHRRAMDGLLEPIHAKPKLILDLGSATGAGTRQLAALFRSARVVGVDIAHSMLRAGRGKRWRFSRIREVQGSAVKLPFRDGAFDMVVANLSPPWFTDPEASFTEIARVLRKEGLFAFSSLGPDSLIEIRNAWQDLDDRPHVHPFVDMHVIGDALVSAGLRDPVLDVERLSVTYGQPTDLFRELTNCGARNLHAGRQRGLSGRRRFEAFERNLRANSGDGPIALTVEFVFGHAWGGGPRQRPQEFRLDPRDIGRLRRNM